MGVKRGRVRTGILAALSVVLAVFNPAMSTARNRAVDLSSQTDAIVTGSTVASPGDGPNGPHDWGDVNGDGEPDVIVAKRAGTYLNRENTGIVYVLFGPFQEGELNVENPSTEGFRIGGASSDDYSGTSLAGVGDVNGDGLDDVLIGAPHADNGRGDLTGVAYVVFGKPTEEDVDLMHFELGIQGEQGFRIDGAEFRDMAGTNVDGIGDINGDDLDDMVVQSIFAGSTYVVFGKADTEPVDLREFNQGDQGPQGFRIKHPGAPSSGPEYHGVEGVGDVNGDDVPDMYIDACIRQTDSGHCTEMRAWIVFGKTDSKLIRVWHLRNNKGFSIHGGMNGSALSLRPGRAGDVNRDGLSDVAVLRWPRGVNKAFVVFGKRNTRAVDLDDIGRYGYKIKARPRLHDGEKGPLDVYELWESAAAGDVNKDGVPDMLLSAPVATPRQRKFAGSVFVVYGQKHRRKPIKLEDLGARGYRIDGSQKKESISREIAGAPSLNPGSRPDFMIWGGVDRSLVYLSWGRRL